MNVSLRIVLLPGVRHMNGRIYNPSTGRFLLVDPFLNDPSNAQSFNRYSYVLNNPTKLIDPIGYAELEINGGGR